MIVTIILLYFILTRLFDIEREVLLYFYVSIGIVYVLLFVGHAVITGGANLLFGLILFFL
jgi:hypothetical protein